MRKIYFLLASMLALAGAFAQEQGPRRQPIPLTITVFSESVGLPNFKSLVKKSNLGVRVGTEFYYRTKEARQIFQSLNLAYYNHKNFQRGFSVSSEFGYRQFIGKTFVDATVGIGYLLINSSFPRYELHGDSFSKSSSTFGRIMPTLGLGAGYQFKTIALFGRYEMFGEMPFGFKGLPVLPHKALHMGTRLKIK